MWWMTVAFAAPLAGPMFGADFRSNGAVGVVSPRQPAVLQVMYTDVGLTCAEALALEEDREAFKAKKPTLVSLSFRWPTQGAAPETVMVAGPAGYGRLAGSQTLATLPSAKGKQGEVRFASEGAVADEMSFVVEGIASFELCSELPVRPDLSATTFTEAEVDLGDGVKVMFGVPTGWTAGKGPFGSPQWTAPDGKTKLSLGAESGLLPFREQAAARAKNQVENFRGEGMSSESVHETPGDTAYVSHWWHRTGFGPWQHQLDVYRQDGKDGPLVVCTVEGDATAAGQVFAAAQKACTSTHW